MAVILLQIHMDPNQNPLSVQVTGIQAIFHELPVYNRNPNQVILQLFQQLRPPVLFWKRVSPGIYDGQAGLLFCQ